MGVERVEGKRQKVVQREKNGFLYRRRRVSKEDENRVREE
jgi:hypothetical protein